MGKHTQTMPAGRTGALLARIDRELSGTAAAVERTLQAACPSLGMNPWSELFDPDTVPVPETFRPTDSRFTLARDAYIAWCRDDLGLTCEVDVDYHTCGTDDDPCPCWEEGGEDIPREDACDDLFEARGPDCWEEPELLPWVVSPHLF